LAWHVGASLGSTDLETLRNSGHAVCTAPAAVRGDAAARTARAFRRKER